MYQKIYRTYQDHSHMGLNLAQCVALLLEKAAQHTENMHRAIINRDTEMRVSESNKAAMILGGLKDTVIPSKETENPASKVLEQYYGTFQELIFRASMKSDAKTAETLTTNLRGMAEFWRNMETHLEGISTYGTTQNHGITEPVSLGV